VKFVPFSLFFFQMSNHVRIILFLPSCFKKGAVSSKVLQHDNASSDAVEEAKAITSSLRRTHAMLGDSLEQAGDAKHVLVGDSEVLTNIFDQHRNIGSSVKKAGKVNNPLFLF
jgi:hypothetical protein